MIDLRRKASWWGPWRNVWTTIGATVYYPRDRPNPPEQTDWELRHELVHVEQWRRYGVWFWISYLLLPVPIGLAWYRWRWEREAYLVDLKIGVPLEDVLRALGSWTYFWPWPKRWMRQWFEKQI